MKKSSSANRRVIVGRMSQGVENRVLYAVNMLIDDQVN